MDGQPSPQGRISKGSSCGAGLNKPTVISPGQAALQLQKQLLRQAQGSCVQGWGRAGATVPGGHSRTRLSHLHPNDGVDEEKHGNQEADVGQRLREKHMSHLIYHSPRGAQNTQVSCAGPSLLQDLGKSPCLGAAARPCGLGRGRD